MKRLLAHLSLLALVHMIMVASGGRFFEEILKPDGEVLMVAISSIGLFISGAAAISLYTVIYFSTKRMKR
ncbi:MAG: hypothetical protein WDO14_14020 [Bacteroidota bacterium]